MAVCLPFSCSCKRLCLQRKVKLCQTGGKDNIYLKLFPKVLQADEMGGVT